MIARLLLLAALLALSACNDKSSAPPPPEPPPSVRLVDTNGPVDVVHDDARGVTCWRLNTSWGNAITCLPDSALARDGGAQ